MKNGLEVKLIANINYHKYYGKEPTLASCKGDIKKYDKELKAYKKSQFYRCKTNNNIISYLTRKSAVDKMDDETKKMIQSIEKEAKFNSSGTDNNSNTTTKKSNLTGLFGKDGEIKKDKLNELKKDLQETKSNIWSGVLSFTEEYGNLVCNKKSDAKKIIKNSIEQLFKNQGLDANNINYMCSFHTNTNNPHIHFIYWEKKPLQFNSKGEKKFSDTCYPKLTDATDSFKSAVLHYCEMQGKQIDFSERDIIRKNFSSNNFEKENLTRIQKLNKDLGNHSNQYARLSKEQRGYVIDFINEYISSNSTLKKIWDSYISKLQSMQKDINNLHIENKIPLSISAKNFSKSRISELYSRCGNEVLKMAREIENEENRIRDEQKKKFENNSKENYSNKTSQKSNSNLDLKKEKSHQLKGQNPQYIYVSQKMRKDLINFLSHLISDKNYQMYKNISDVLKEFYDDLEKKGENTIYGTQE